MEKIDIYTSVVPNHRQKIVQDMKFYAFIHFTVNTFTGKEWGNGTESPSIFNPTDLDTDSWCEAIKSSGMKGVILTCKHHDGFCLWPTRTTEHCIRNAPYKGGKGDIVAELAASCKRYGLKFGVYLSPWDRNSEYYSTDKYMDFYIQQLTELLTNYGDIFMLWLDGACASHRDGKPAQKYDFDRIYAKALELQPNICMSGCAPDIRWVGNESGVARESEWNVVPKYDYAYQNFAAECQQDDDFVRFQKRCRDVMVKDMGSREFLSKYDEFMWYPAEVDVSIRLGWFYHWWQIFCSRSLRQLMKMYYGSVGGNCLFLLNIPPNSKGRFANSDIKKLNAMGKWIRKEEDLSIKINTITASSSSKPSFEIEKILTNATYSPINESDIYLIKCNFDKVKIDRVHLREDTDYSQRVEKYEIWTSINSVDKLLFTGSVIGFNKIAIFLPILTDNITIKITECRHEPYINLIDIKKEGAYRV